MDALLFDQMKAQSNMQQACRFANESSLSWLMKWAHTCTRVQDLTGDHEVYRIGDGI